MKQHDRGRIIRLSAGVAAFAVLAAGCSGSDGAEADATVPVSEAPVATVAEAPVTVAPVPTDPPEVEPALDATEIPDLPCVEYVEESGYPLKPCDSGVLVETLQRDLESLFPEIAIDGLFGSQTAGFVEEFQTSNDLEATGLVSEELADRIAAAEELGESTSDTGDGETGTTSDEADGDGEDATTVEFCNELIGDADNPDFTATQIEVCSDLGVDIVGEG